MNEWDEDANELQRRVASAVRELEAGERAAAPQEAEVADNEAATRSAREQLAQRGLSHTRRRDLEREIEACADRNAQVLTGFSPHTAVGDVAQRLRARGVDVTDTATYRPLAWHRARIANLRAKLAAARDILADHESERV